ncbi:MAG: hypothetical protein AAGI03_00010 [Pseudomonadota bacterium]
MAPPFDAGQGFGLDKPGGTACPNLDCGDRCTIHGARAEQGFGGCIAFDCGGVGQYVSESLFDGVHWRASAAVRAEMTAAFLALRRVAAVSELLEAAQALPLVEADRAAIGRYLERLWPPEGWCQAALLAFDRGPDIGDMHRFLRSLRRYLETPGRVEGQAA